MLPSSNRLPKEKISELTRFGKRIAIDEMRVCYKKTSGAPRFAVIVSTKIDRRATKRNRMRRIISESLRHILPPVDAVIIVRKHLDKLSQKEVQAKLESVLHEIVFT